jgi:hypothetical protein
MIQSLMISQLNNCLSSQYCSQQKTTYSLIPCNLEEWDLNPQAMVGDSIMYPTTKPSISIVQIFNILLILFLLMSIQYAFIVQTTHTGNIVVHTLNDFAVNYFEITWRAVE